MSKISILVASILFASGAAFAANASSTATLSAPVGSETKIVKDGKIWLCAADACSTEAGYATRNRLIRACRAIAKKAGAVSAISSGDISLTEEDLSSCNR